MKRKPTRKYTRISVRVSPAEKARFVKSAGALGISVSQRWRDVIREGLESARAQAIG